MTAAEVLQQARQYGVEVIPNGQRLRLRAPQEPPAEVVEVLRAHKGELLAWLTRDDSGPAHRAVIEYRIPESGGRWVVLLGAPGETYESAAEGLRRRYGDRLLDVRPYSGAKP